MSLLIDNVFQFDVWETMDQETMELTRTSEFWTQVQYEADRIDLIPPADNSDDLENDLDWRIPETPEDPPKESIVHHDCMWAGSDSVRNSNTFVPSDLMVATPGQSLLRRDASPPRPETPPSVDGDDVPEFLHAVDVAGTALRLLRDSAAVAADHSYTLARQHMDYLGVQTPSDSGESEEEIDVVSVGNSTQTFTGVVSPSQTLEYGQEYTRISPIQEKHHPRAGDASHRPRPTVARKRLIPPVNIAASVPRRRRGPGRRGRPNTDTDSEAESPEIERRSIHNDMERLRRIGLKNLFDELKKQIPATRDKERAPKVVILREAAALCRKLREEELEREQLKKKQDKLLIKLRKLRVTAAKRCRQF
ncbi:myc proto-oncogene protein [Aricia agestis]|uniref:myc proto-oncogene protein n=1 Tax=Aricia agestis TaxID=91739 RepID=UPI001C2034BE|nr:myc proto-oncogene protein [Aricia agestis]